LCGDVAIKRIINIELVPSEEVDRELLLKVERITGDNILRRYRPSETLAPPEGDLSKLTVVNTAASAQILKEHWDILGFLAGKLARGLYLPECTRMWPVEGPTSVPKDLDALQAVYWLKGESMETSDTRDEVRAEWKYYPDLLVHMKAEDPKWEANMSTARTKLSDYYAAVYLLARKIEEEAEKRTGLPYDKKFNYGLTFHFTYKVFTQAVIGPSESGYRIEGLSLWLSDVGLAKVKSGEENILANVKKVHQKLAKNVRRWTGFKKIRNLYDSASEAIVPLRESLILVSKRKTFREGRCPSCPL
jgi:hypothetical protein